MNYQPVVTGNQPNDNACIKENLDAGKVEKETIYAQQYMLLPLWSTGSQDPQNTNDDAAFDVKENENDAHVFSNGSNKSANKKHDEKSKRDDKGKKPVDSPTGVQDLRAKFEEFSFNSTNRVNAVSAPVTAAEPNSTKSTNSFNTASPSANAVSPNFGIAKNSSFVDPFKYPDDPDMPELEDIVYSDDKKDVGAEADLSNLEINIPVSLILTTIVYKYHHVNQIIGDLNSTPQTRSMTKMVKEQGRVHQINDEDFHTYLPKGKRAIGSKWVFRNKKDERGIVIRNKARLVARGHTQEEGIDYDEVFTLVARIEAIRYLKGKPHLALWYPKDAPFNLVAYFDSDYAGASLDRKSTTGGYQFLGYRLISWQCKKQTVVATSSNKAEYVAAASCYAQVLWIQN
nr:uncharacterized mitochondrial protein AtMg00810-like [Tanacetum cinerariifolium]